MKKKGWAGQESKQHK